MAAFLLIAQGSLNLELGALDGAWVMPPRMTDQKLAPEILQTLSFGHLPAAVDWLWLTVLQDTTLSSKFNWKGGTHAPIFYDLDLLTDLDPIFFDSYMSGANLLTVVRNDNLGARDLLLKADRVIREKLPSYPEFIRTGDWSQAWTVYALLAYIYLFELRDVNLASGAFIAASEQPNGAPYLRALAERLQRPEGKYEVGLRLVEFLLRNEKNPDVHEGLLKKREYLLISQYLFGLRQNPPKRLPDRDPWGGKLSRGADGKIRTTTPYEPTFGLE